MSELSKLIAEFHATLAKFEEIAKRMEEREESTRVIAADPTMRDLPFPNGVIPPTLPEGKTRWIYRGDDFSAGNGISANGRHVLFADGDDWYFADAFSYPVHHIEAV
jgi:hypothetical protein